ncbi:MAG TPA: hypothetical protein VK589_23235 [Chryseolinea sp.]|nr:hypothetical protein [Chryseolinea sp.]
MKNMWLKIYSTGALILLIILTSCETEPIIFRGPYHVRFTEPTAYDKESFSQPIDIQVHIAGPAPEEELTIGYLIGGNAREDVDYVILDERKKVRIAAGEYFGNIRIQLINNANNILRSQDIVFTLISANQDNLEIGQGSSAIGKEFTFTIFDDCILGGSYSGKRAEGGTTYSDISINSQDCETYLLSNWNLGVFQTDQEMDLTFIDNGDNTLTIPEQEEEFIDDELATMKGTGVVDPVTREIILKIMLVDFDDQPEVSIVYKPI